MLTIQYNARQHHENVFVDSKDAKKIVCKDITPVQKSSKTWGSGTKVAITQSDSKDTLIPLYRYNPSRGVDNF